MEGEAAHQPQLEVPLIREVDEPERLARVEVFLEDHGAPVRHDREERVLTPKPPKEREAHPEPIRLAEGVIRHPVTPKIDLIGLTLQQGAAA